MGYGYRKFIVHDDGTLDRMRNNVFDQLLRDPQHHSMPAMVGKRVRVADIDVQLENRRPVCVVRRVYFVVSFDDEGRLDTKRFLQQQWALVESAPDPVLAEPNHGDRILDTTSRLIAQGGRWRPKADLAQLIDEAALGRRWSRSAGHALALPKGAVRGYRHSVTTRHWRRAGLERVSC
jgi:hypothetical protein